MKSLKIYLLSILSFSKTTSG